MSALLRHCRLRTAFLALLVLGMVVSPALAAVGELHGVEHAVAAASVEPHGHTHSADDDHHDHDHGGGEGSDPDHATGSHGLMHQATSLSVTLPVEPLTVSDVALCEPLLPEFRLLPMPGDAPNLPFRPPIA
jgi:hypothetical protein